MKIIEYRECHSKKQQNENISTRIDKDKLWTETQAKQDDKRNSKSHG